ncbi:MAG: WecB/TagA/CpsF family glycosyltransferase [Aquabacterium sp.]|nr:WecB/TagA/CpsF family glycosyltransferase [Aquabacterium sp.]
MSSQLNPALRAPRPAAPANAANAPPASSPHLVTANEAAATLRFGPFPITECQQFPPAAGPQCWVYLTLNAEIALSLEGNPTLQALIRSPRARLSIDGQWLWWALRRKYPQQPLRKLAGSDLIGDLAAHCARHGQRLLLLGSTPLANGGAVQRLRQRCPGLQVAGFAPSAYQPGHASEQAVLAQSLAAIAAWGPQYVVLGLGATREQRFAQALATGLDGRVQGLLCFGGAIDLASGQVRRAPALWQRTGLEGLWRVLAQPARLGRLLRVLRILPRLARGDY